VLVAIEPCPRPATAVTPGRLASRSCPAMTLAAWQPLADELRRALPAALRSRPDTRFELGAHDLSGQPAIYTYQLGAAFGKDDHDQPTGDYIDTYTLYYHDGQNQLRVTASYRDDAVGGVDRLLAIAPPEDLEQLALAFASFYVHEWR